MANGFLGKFATSGGVANQIKTVTVAVKKGAIVTPGAAVLYNKTTGTTEIIYGTSAQALDTTYSFYGVVGANVATQTISDDLQTTVDIPVLLLNKGNFCYLLTTDLTGGEKGLLHVCSDAQKGGLFTTTTGGVETGLNVVKIVANNVILVEKL